jgi:hypothetical protein
VDVGLGFHLTISNKLVTNWQMDGARKNPFKFGDPVDGEFYLDRPQLDETIMNFVNNRIHVVLIGPRRFGKTSFVMDLIRKAEKQGKSCLFIDIYNVTSHRDFLHQILRSLKRKKGWRKKLKDWLNTLPRLKPKLSFDIDPVTSEVGFTISPEITTEKEIKETIQDTLSALGDLVDLVVIDEFQKIAELEDQGWLEATLRTEMQQLKKTSFLFTGSRRNIIHDMLNNSSRPFYRSCQPFEFPVFEDEFSDWIIHRFKTVKIKCGKDEVRALRKMVQDTPNYVQMVCFYLVAEGVEVVTIENLNGSLRKIVKQNAYAYQTLLSSLTPTQQRVLRLAAIESGEIYSKDLLRKYEISSGPAMASAIKSLKDKQILDEGEKKGSVSFDDPLFSIWLKDEFEGL